MSRVVKATNFVSKFDYMLEMGVEGCTFTVQVYKCIQYFGFSL